MIEPAKRIGNVEEYYFSKKLEEVRALDAAGHPVINLGIGSPDLPPAPSVIEALKASAGNPRNHAYQNYRGIPAFRQAIASFYQRTYGVILNPENMILPLIGSKEGVMHITLAFVNPGDEVLVPDPGYPTYASAARLAGARTVPYAVNVSGKRTIDLKKLQGMELSNVRLMWINFPHMPTGRVASQAELSDLVELARVNGFMIVNDNPYSLILNEQPLSLLSVRWSDQVALELNSLSKSHNMAGWRLGWVAGKREYIDTVLRVKSNMDSGMFLPLQQAAVVALGLGRDWFDQLNSIYGKRRQVVKRILDALGCTYSEDQAGLFVWAGVPSTVVDVGKWIDDILYGAHVFITPGSVFGENGRRFVRVSLCNTEEVLNAALARIETYIRKASGKQLVTGVQS